MCACNIAPKIKEKKNFFFSNKSVNKIYLPKSHKCDFLHAFYCESDNSKQ